MNTAIELENKRMKLNQKKKANPGKLFQNKIEIYMPIGGAIYGL
jgi:hypothetical protein